jgi:isoleucyl-tRNA synthetase
MKYKDLWDDLTRKIGYWVDLDHPYITFENKYIESIWYLLSKLYEKGLLYKGYSIQPYSPAAGTGLSTHELNQPGCYRDVKDNSLTAQFKLIRDEKSEFLFQDAFGDVFVLAWTTTPWTLPSNTALAIGKNIEYIKIKTFNPYTYLPITVILAKELMGKFFPEKNANLNFGDCLQNRKIRPQSYPHCWRTDKPILYYPLDSWFIKTTAFKDRMLELNNTINWKPKSTGSGRFGNWLENLVDWNLSRSRFWGVGMPIWTTADKKEQICIGSVLS